LVHAAKYQAESQMFMFGDLAETSSV